MTAGAGQAGRQDDVATLRLVYDELCAERDRLRDARKSFSSKLGPLPAAAGISTGTIAVFARHVHHPWLLWVALLLFVLLVVVGMLYVEMPAYRQIRATKETEWRQGLTVRHPDLATRVTPNGPRIEDLLSPADWYGAMIELERQIYGSFDSKRNKILRPSRNVESLQDALDRERTGLYAVQFLFVLMILVVAASELIGA